MAVARNLRYSPVNWLIVDWGFEGKAFNDCGLPEPQPCLTEGHDCDGPCQAILPIREAIDTYDWARWLPEVIVGIEDADEEIAANYVRQAAIEFCNGGRVLQREVVVELQPDESTYPLFPYEGEMIKGVIGIMAEDGCRCGTHSGCCSGWVGGVDWVFDVARQQVTVSGPCKGLLRLLVWSAPTEDACEHDVFLYDNFRREITAAARLYYANAVHFRDRLLMSSLPTKDSIDRAIVLAKTRVMTRPNASKAQGRSGLFGSRCGSDDTFNWRR